MTINCQWDKKLVHKCKKCDSHLWAKRGLEGMTNVWRVTCYECQVETPPFFEEQGAIDAWNNTEEKEIEIDVELLAKKVVQVLTVNCSDEGETPAHYRSKLQFDDSQKAAIEYACTNRFSIINGGAGSGKTTIIQAIAENLKFQGEAVKLCAFTGKAAARLKEATSFTASTIHSLLKSNGESFQLQDLHYTTVIIDEASMNSSELLAEITKRDPTRLILVGDEAQLTPVDKGQPFHDIINIMPEKVCNLTTCYRNKEAVFKAAIAIRNGHFPEQEETTENEKWSIVKTSDADAAHARILDLVKSGAIDFQKDIILCPKNGEIDTPCTVKGLNHSIVAIVNPREGDERFLPGDRVINTKNCAEKDVWNGTTGTIEAIDQRGNIWVELDIPIVDQEKTTDQENPIYKTDVLFNKKMVKSLQLAYALTVHKSQGSQYRKVVFVALSRDTRILSRSLIYTAITRTQQECIVIGQAQALWRGIENQTNKRTIIQELNR